MHLVGEEIGLDAVGVIAAGFVRNESADERLQILAPHRLVGIVPHALAVAVDITGYKEALLHMRLGHDVGEVDPQYHLEAHGVQLVDQAAKIAQTLFIGAPVAQRPLPAVVDHERGKRQPFAPDDPGGAADHRRGEQL